MTSPHICVESCFAARSSDRLTINCYLCDRRFNSKCFDLSQLPILKTITATNNVLFLCQRCIDRVSRMKNTARKSAGINQQTTMQLMNDDEIPSNDTPNVDTISNVLAQLRLLQDNIARISVNTEAHVQTQERNFSMMNDKIDQRLTAHASELHSDSQIITMKLNDLQHCINNPAIHSKSLFPVNTVHVRSSSSALLANPNKSSISADPLNWSFSFNQSTTPNDNIELYQLLHGFEKNTWTTFDYLRSKLNENIDTVRNIESICEEIRSNDNRQHLESPTTDSIKIDCLHDIQDKCVSIESKISNIGNSINQFANCSAYTGSHINKAGPSPTTITLTENISERPSDHVRSITTNVNDESQQIIPLTPRNQPPVLLPSSSSSSSSNPALISSHAPISDANHQVSTNVELVAASFKEKKWFYVSNLKPGTTESTMKSYICDKMNVPPSEVIVKSLLKKDHDPSSITYTSFKVGIEESIDTTKMNSIWPRNITSSVFVPKNEFIRRHR